MRAGWCVRVSVFDDLVVSISERELCGTDLTEADQELIRDCARHLLSFVGSRSVADFAVDRVGERWQKGDTRDTSSLSSSRCPVEQERQEEAFRAGMGYGVHRSGWTADEAWADYKRSASLSIVSAPPRLEDKTEGE